MGPSGKVRYFEGSELSGVLNTKLFQDGGRQTGLLDNVGQLQFI